MKLSRPITLVTLSCSIFALAFLVAPREVSATNWQATAGAQSTDEGIQALAFLPNELWIHVGDSITWKLVTKVEPHTVTFLIANQIRNPFNVGCPGYSPDNSPFDGTA